MSEQDTDQRTSTLATRPMSPEALQRQREGQAKGRATVIAALAARKALTDEANIFAQVRAMAQQAMPGIMANMIRIAKGEQKGKQPAPPASAQTTAAGFVASATGYIIEAKAARAPGGPLSEMALGELESSLSGILESVQTLRAIESQSERIDSADDVLPHSGSEGADCPPAAPAVSAD